MAQPVSNTPVPGLVPGGLRAPLPRRVLPVIVLAQCAGTSPWFAVNAMMPDLQQAFGWPAQAVGTLTAAVQLGFIAGTLVFALLALADRHSARALFLACALASAACTWGASLSAGSMPALWAWRLATGFCLAGICPVGMKIAAQWFPQGPGAALGWLVGALVLGSASPHALRALGTHWPWTQVFVVVACKSAAAGLLLYLAVSEPPHAPARAVGLQLSALASLWRDGRVRASRVAWVAECWCAAWVVPASLPSSWRRTACAACWRPGHCRRRGLCSLRGCSCGASPWWATHRSSLH